MKMRFVVLFALCAAFANTQEFELEFVPAGEAPEPPNIFQAAMQRMEAMSHNMAEMMENNIDASRPIKRGVTETREEFSPLPGLQVEIEMQTAGPRGPGGESPAQDLFQQMRQRAQMMAKKMKARRNMFAKRLKERMKRFKAGIMKRVKHPHLPRWMHKLSDKSRFFHAKKMRRAWLRKAVDAKCGSDKEQFCPGIKCPKKLAMCLHQHEDEVSEQCGAFLTKLDELTAMKKQARKVHYQAAKHCQSLPEEDQRECFKAAHHERVSSMHDIKTKFMQLKNDEEDDLSEAKDSHTLQGLADEAAKTFKTKMSGLETMLQGLVKKATGEKPAETSTSGCSGDTCQTGGDMGGYCKENNDCHCTAPFFSSTGTTCQLSCSPTSSTPCCRDDSDCRTGGDTGAYCKSPKSNAHTEPGNGMCRCSPGFEGTTGCKKKKVKAETKPKGTADMNESTPAYLTGDVEAPKGEKDMGGWTMAVYTPEQQARLGLDEVGKPVAAVDPAENKKEGKDSESIWPAWLMEHLLLVLGVGAFLALLMSALIVRRYRALRQSVELRAVYNSAMTAVPTEISAIKDSSVNQI